jgi:hypothetical protein
MPNSWLGSVRRVTYFSGGIRIHVLREDTAVSCTCLSPCSAYRPINSPALSQVEMMAMRTS